MLQFSQMKLDKQNTEETTVSMPTEHVYSHAAIYFNWTAAQTEMVQLKNIFCSNYTYTKSNQESLNIFFL